MKEKKTAILILAILLSLSIPAAFSTTDTLSVDYTFELEMIGAEVRVKDTQIQEIPGEPLVPYRSAAILLPQSTMLKDVKVKTSAPIVQTGIEIPWGQPPCTFSDEPVIVGKNEEIYTSDNDYPHKVFEVVSVESFRGFQILNVILYPVQYKPKSQTVKFYENMTVEVKFGKKMKNKLYRGLYDDKAAVVGMVDNPEVAGTYEDGPAPLQTEEYIIITNDTMQSTFQTLANWKASYVNGANVYTVSWITSNYSGVDNQEKMRNFIIDKYTNNGLKYVLLGGDTAAVPYRGFYVSTGGYTDSDMAADMYFAHLDGNHNADGDSRYGETNDNVDFYAEVAVGRAPCQSTAEATAFVEKVIDYEQMSKPDVGAHERVCFHQSRVLHENDPDSRCLAWNCDDWIPGGYYIDYLFEEDDTVTKTKWRNAFTEGPIVVVHIGHGNTTVYRINYEEGGTVDWYNSDVPSLTNAFFPWTTSTACICGEIEANDCLAEAYVMDDCGAIGAIYNDNYGWFSSDDACKYSGEFCEMEVRACWSDGYEKLGDLLNRSRYYMAGSASISSTYRWCFYERNLIGDPETPCLTTRNGGQSSPEEYIIITSDALQPTFQQLANWKANFVNGTGVYTVSWICSNYSGVDNREKIRNFIIDMYTNHSTKYVLLGGDVSVVPYRGFYVSAGGYDEEDLPADMYYAHLDGNWNNDGDSRYAEPGEEDWYADIAVGRAPVETVSEAQTFVNKVITYEQAPKEKVCQFHQSRLYPENDPDSRQIAWDCEQWVPTDYVKKELFEEDQQVTKELWREAWTGEFDGEPHYPPLTFLHIGLGGTDYVYLNYYPPVIWYISDVSSLTNTNFFPVFISAASFVGDFRVDDCLAEELVKDDAGAIAAIVNANEHCDCCDEFVEAFFKALFDDGMEHLGDALNQGKTYMASSASSDPYCRWCFYAFNLIGDPETPILTQRSCSVTITNPVDGSVVTKTVDITTSTSECIDTVKFYAIVTSDDDVFGEWLCTVTAPPFGCSWDTDCYLPGWYTIRADGYESGSVVDVDEITVFVDSRYIIITNPPGGSTVSGTVTIAVEANHIDEVRFYIDGVHEYTDTAEPFSWNWHTTHYANGSHTITVEAYESGELVCEEEITCTVNNGGEGLGTVLLALLVLLGSAGITTRRH